MQKSLEASGATIEDAVNAALAQLNLERDDVTVEVLEKPKAGFFGIGATQAKVKVSYDDTPTGRAVDFISGLLSHLGVIAQADAKVDTENGTIFIELSGSDMGMVIGRRGDTLDAIQYLSSLVVNKGEEQRYRVIIDTENYRAKREASLVQLASKMAGKVLKYKKPMSLEPMNPYERRIIHAALQDYKGVTTYSTGMEPGRKVVISPAGMPPRQGGGPYRAGGGKGRSYGGQTGKRNDPVSQKPN